MADDSLSEEQWLYGDSTNETEKPAEATPKEEESTETKVPEEQEETEKEPEKITEVETKEEKVAEEAEPPPETPTETDPSAKTEPVEDVAKKEEEEEEDEDDDDDSDDNVHVTIGDIKATPQYSNLNIKRGVPLAAGVDKLKQQPGKFSIEEFESIGTINGVPAHEFSIDALEEKPWRKPGADITDYFNYGFNEETWRAYCERQKQMRMHESGVGLGGLGVSSRSSTALPVVNDNSKYSGINSAVVVGSSRKAGPPPGPRRHGVIDVIGGSGVASRRTTDSPPKENAIQVMTADKRDYGRKNFDMSVPPPGFDATTAPIPPVVSSYTTHATYNTDFYNPDVDTYYQNYEPTQDLQWNSQGWRGRRHRRSPSHHSPPHSHSYRSKSDHYSRGSTLTKESSLQDGPGIKQESMEKGRERERERDRHKDRHRHHSRSRSGDRSERRSRKHKSRSRSPGHRSHKKKKSKKSERSKDSSD